MKGILISWVLSTGVILLTAYVLPGIAVESLASAFIAAAVLGILNALVKPILFVLTLPITLLTLGLFLLVLNGIMIWITSALVPGFKVQSFGWAVIASVIISIISFILQRIF